MLKLWKRLALAGALASACAAAPAQAQPAQLLPGPTPQKVYDSTGRLVGTLLPTDPGGYAKVLVRLPEGEALLNIRALGFYVETNRPKLEEFLDSGVYYAAADCSGPAYMIAVHFLNYAQIVRPNRVGEGSSNQPTIRYATRPFVSVDLVAQRMSTGACVVLSEPRREQLAGVAKTFTMPSYQLPFIMK